MSHLADTNLLLRGADAGHPMQSLALQALAGLVQRGEAVYITPQNLFEFWVVATRPTERNGLGLTAIEAEEELAELEARFALLPDTPGVYREWRRLVREFEVVGVRAHDTRLVASALTHGVSHILTFNVPDFRRYVEITLVHPQDVPGPLGRN